MGTFGASAQALRECATRKLQRLWPRVVFVAPSH